MKMDKSNTFTGDYYVLDIPIEEDAPICICIAAVLDYWLYRKNNGKDTPSFLSFRFLNRNYIKSLDNDQLKGPIFFLISSLFHRRQWLRIDLVPK